MPPQSIHSPQRLRRSSISDIDDRSHRMKRRFIRWTTPSPCRSSLACWPCARLRRGFEGGSLVPKAASSVSRERERLTARVSFWGSPHATLISQPSGTRLCPASRVQVWKPQPQEHAVCVTNALRTGRSQKKLNFLTIRKATGRAWEGGGSIPGMGRPFWNAWYE